MFTATTTEVGTTRSGLGRVRRDVDVGRAGVRVARLSTTLVDAGMGRTLTVPTITPEVVAASTEATGDDDPLRTDRAAARAAGLTVVPAHGICRWPSRPAC